MNHATLSVHVVKAEKYLLGYLLYKMYWHALCLGSHNPMSESIPEKVSSEIYLPDVA